MLLKNFISLHRVVFLCCPYNLGQFTKRFGVFSYQYWMKCCFGFGRYLTPDTSPTAENIATIDEPP